MYANNLINVCALRITQLCA